MEKKSLNFTEGDNGPEEMWTHEASVELLEFGEKWLEKWAPALILDRKEHRSHYVGDTSGDAWAAASLITAVMGTIHELQTSLTRNGNVREFMKDPETLWDALGLPPEEWKVIKMKKERR